MPRLPVLLGLFLALLAGMYLALRGDSGDPGAAGGSEPSTAAGDSAEPILLTSPGLSSGSTESAESTREALEARAEEWVVEVRAASAHPMPEARIVATLENDRLEGTGTATWTRPLAGTWTLEVSAPDVETWKRAIVLVPGRAERTMVTLGAGLRVRGRVIDTLGAARASHLVGFVPHGGGAPTNPREWLALPHGRTGTDGTFEAELPGAGTWRAFVGFAGKVLFEESPPAALDVAGPSRVDIVIPTPPRLIVEVVDAPGVPRTAAHGVSVYRQKHIMDVERPLPPQPAEVPPLPDPDDPSLDEETRAEVVHVLKKREQERLAREERIRAAGGVDVDAILQERRRKVVPEGWRTFKSGYLDANDRIVFELTPIGDELRFAASRGTEAFRVEGSAWMVQNAVTKVRIVLPGPLPDDAPITPEPRTVQAEVGAPRPEDELSAPGATWR